MPGTNPQNGTPSDEISFTGIVMVIAFMALLAGVGIATYVSNLTEGAHGRCPAGTSDYRNGQGCVPLPSAPALKQNHVL